MIGLLGIEPAKISNKTHISTDTELILNTLSSLESRINEISNKVDFTPRITSSLQIQNQVIDAGPGNWVKLNIAALKDGDEVHHEKFGLGLVLSVKGEGINKIATVNFGDFGEKLIMLKMAKLLVRK